MGWGVLVAGGHSHFHFQCSCCVLTPLRVSSSHVGGRCHYSSFSGEEAETQASRHADPLEHFLVGWKQGEVWFLPSLPSCWFSLPRKLKGFIPLLQWPSRQGKEVLKPKVRPWGPCSRSLTLFYVYGCFTCMYVLVLLTRGAHGGWVVHP